MSEGDPGASEADISVYEPANASPMKHLSVTEKNPGMAQFAISAAVTDPGTPERNLSLSESNIRTPQEIFRLSEADPSAYEHAITCTRAIDPPAQRILFAKVAVLVYLLSLVTLGRFQVVHADKTHGGDHGHDTSY